MSLEITGKVHIIEQEKEIGNNGFKKRLLVIETDEQYKQYIPIDFLKDKCHLLDKFNTGDQVKVSINIRGNEYKGKYYCAISGWKIERLATEAAPAQIPPMPTSQPFEPASDFKEEDHDDLPF